MIKWISTCNECGTKHETKDRFIVKMCKRCKGSDISAPEREERTVESQKSATKYCNSCMERGLGIVVAFRQYQEGMWYCDDCFKAEIEKMTSIPADMLQSTINRIENFEAGPILTKIYELLNIPPELQFESVDSVLHHKNQLFVHHAPSNLNLTLEQAQLKLEQMAIAMFQFQIITEPLEEYIKKLKQRIRVEKGLSSYDDSKEVFTKVKKTVDDTTANAARAKRIKNKVANIAKIDVDASDLVKEMAAAEAKMRERKFWILSDNCPECGGAKPCEKHPNASIL